MTEEKKTICYGVSHGEYSDYRIAAIFSSEEKAEEWLATLSSIEHCPICESEKKFSYRKDKKIKTNSATNMSAPVTHANGKKIKTRMRTS